MMMSWSNAAELAAVLALIGLTLRGRTARLSAFVIEASLVAALYSVWQLATKISVMGTANALIRAEWIAKFEHTIHLPSEATVQALILPHPWLVQAANLYYATMHFTALFIFLMWLYFRHRDRYPAVRTTLALSTLSCLVIQFIPVAPPRLLPAYVDTAITYGQSVYGGGLTVDELSAMPSVHVLWAVIIGWYAVRVGKSRWRFIAPVHSVITVLVVVSTGNHWWLDGIVAVSVLIVCAWARYGVVRAWLAIRPPVPATIAIEPEPDPLSEPDPRPASDPQPALDPQPAPDSQLAPEPQAASVARTVSPERVT